MFHILERPFIVLEGPGDVLEGLADDQRDVEVGSAVLGNQEEQVDGLALGVDGDPGIHTNGRAEGVQQRDQEVVGVFQLGEILGLQKPLDGEDDGNLAVGRDATPDEALDGLDASNLDQFRVVPGDGVDDVVEETKGWRIDLRQGAGDEVPPGTQHGFVLSLDGVGHELEVDVCDFGRHRLFHVLEVVQDGVEQVKRGFLPLPARTLAGEEGLGVSKQAFEGGLV